MARPRKNAAPPPDIIPPQPAPQDAPSTESMEERIRASTNQPDWNVREMLDHLHRWLAYQEEDLSYGLRSISDAVKLYLAHQEGQDMRFPDRWSSAQRIAVLGYDPLPGEPSDE